MAIGQLAKTLNRSIWGGLGTDNRSDRDFLGGNRLPWTKPGAGNITIGGKQVKALIG